MRLCPVCRYAMRTRPHFDRGPIPLRCMLLHASYAMSGMLLRAGLYVRYAATHALCDARYPTRYPTSPVPKTPYASADPPRLCVQFVAYCCTGMPPLVLRRAMVLCTRYAESGTERGAAYYGSQEEYGANGKLLKTIPLVPGGDKVPVKEWNKKRYLTLLARYRLGLLPQPHLPSGICPQMRAVAEGFYSICCIGPMAICYARSVLMRAVAEGFYSIVPGPLSKAYVLYWAYA
eukprot:2188996-Rhodomonas_salina.2